MKFDPVQNVASELGQNCLKMSPKGISSLKRIETTWPVWRCLNIEWINGFCCPKIMTSLPWEPLHLSQQFIWEQTELPEMNQIRLAYLPALISSSICLFFSNRLCKTDSPWSVCVDLISVSDEYAILITYHLQLGLPQGWEIAGDFGFTICTGSNICPTQWALIKK